MADSEAKKIVVPDPSATKAQVFTPVEGERIFAARPPTGMTVPAPEGERPASGAGMEQAAVQLQPAEGPRPNVTARPTEAEPATSATPAGTPSQAEPAPTPEK
jgi:hypothetical protein